MVSRSLLPHKMTTAATVSPSPPGAPQIEQPSGLSYHTGARPTLALQSLRSPQFPPRLSSIRACPPRRTSITAAATNQSSSNIPETSDADYFAAVLCPGPSFPDPFIISSVLSASSGPSSALPACEAELAAALAARAAALDLTSAPSCSRPLEPNADSSTTEKRETYSGQSASSLTTFHGRTFSSGSDASASTALTIHSLSSSPTPSSPSSKPNAAVAPSAGVSAIAAVPAAITSGFSGFRRSHALSFSHYDKYLRQLGPNLGQPKFLKELPPPPPSLCRRDVSIDQPDHPDLPRSSGRSLFSVKTKRSLISLKRNLRNYVWWRKRSLSPPSARSCICCCDEFEDSGSLLSLPCGHSYCPGCLSIMVTQAITDESKMPPRCCTQPVLGSVVKSLLIRDQQTAFLKAVLQFSTPWEDRIFCPEGSCGEFIPPRHKIDPKHPFDIVCKSCRTRVCRMCKAGAHPLGQDCPDDWELEAVLRMGEKSGWRRCYKCRTLVELTLGCTHMTCRCKAQFCYICGAVWDLAIGCPNYCNGDEEMERRRVAEEARAAELEAERAAVEAAAAADAAAHAAAQLRSRDNPALSRLLGEQAAQLDHFHLFVRDVRGRLRSRHAEQKLALSDRLTDQVEKLRERHARTVQHLEDRQVAAEMELRTSLELAEKSVRIRLKHMEAYCEGLSRPRGLQMPPRKITERDLRELGQQYNLRDNLDRLNQAKINILRDRQTKSMNELLERHEDELQRLVSRRDQDLEAAISLSVMDEDELARVLSERAARLRRRAHLMLEIAAGELKAATGLEHAVLPLPDWGERAVELRKIGIVIPD